MSANPPASVGRSALIGLRPPDLPALVGRKDRPPVRVCRPGSVRRPTCVAPTCVRRSIRARPFASAAVRRTARHRWPASAPRTRSPSRARSADLACPPATCVTPACVRLTIRARLTIPRPPGSPCVRRADPRSRRPAHARLPPAFAGPGVRPPGRPCAQPSLASASSPVPPCSRSPDHPQPPGGPCTSGPCASAGPSACPPARLPAVQLSGLSVRCLRQPAAQPAGTGHCCALQRIRVAPSGHPRMALSCAF